MSIEEVTPEVTQVWECNKTKHPYLLITIFSSGDWSDKATGMAVMSPKAGAGYSNRHVGLPTLMDGTEFTLIKDSVFNTRRNVKVASAVPSDAETSALN